MYVMLNDLKGAASASSATAAALDTPLHGWSAGGSARRANRRVRARPRAARGSESAGSAPSPSLRHLPQVLQVR
jgi:hypothetical protein